MNNAMTGYTRQLSTKLAIVLACFTVLACAAAALARYNQGLDQMLVKKRNIKSNLERLLASTIEIRNSNESFRRALPPGYGSRSAELLMFAKMDEIKNMLKPSEIQVKPVENKEGSLSVEFSLKIKNPAYTGLVNSLGQLETSMFPFVSVRSVSIETSTADLSDSTLITIEGAVLMPAPTSPSVSGKKP